MSSEMDSSIPTSTSRSKLQLLTSQNFASLNRTLSAKSVESSPTPTHEISVDDYFIPAPPPPSPVSFRSDKFATATGGDR
ncbi:unnamed protein product [Discula destructiva]